MSIKKKDYSWIDVSVLASNDYFAIYTNDTGSDELISSISCICATGNGHFQDHGNSYGSGKPITVQLGTSNGYTSEATTITAVCTPRGKGSTVRQDGALYTWNFTNAVPCAAGSQIQIYFKNPNPSSGATLCAYPSGVSDANLVTIRPSSYTLSYNANGGSGAPSSQTLYGGTGNVSSSQPSRSLTITAYANGGQYNSGSESISWGRNFTFKGWSTSATGSKEYDPGSSITITQDTTLYAVWGAATVGSLPGVGSGSNDLKSRYILYDFLGWSTASISKSAGVSSNTEVSANTNIYAVWKPYVVLNPNGGTFEDILASDPSSYDKASQVRRLPYDQDQGITLNYAVQLIGYNMSGWSTTASGAAQYGLNYVHSGYTAIYLYASWSTERFTVTFRKGWGNNEIIKTISGIQYGQSLSNSVVPDMTGVYRKPGPDVFQGWSGSYENITENRTLIALWQFSPIWICQYDKDSGQKMWLPYTPEEK